MNRSKIPARSALLAAMLAGFIASSPAADSPGISLARQLNDAFASVAKTVSPAVVVVNVKEKARRGRNGRTRQGDEGEGSGIIVSEDGYILTNNHVVDNADTISVTLQDGRHFTGEVKGTDPKTDIAVVKIKPTGAKLTVARLGDSDKLRVGEFVVAIGHPYELAYSVTVGHVSAIERQLPQDESEPISDEEYIQTDAVINPGNSGGPLINLDGEVIGVNAMIEADTVPFSRITVSRGIGLAIPINEAKAIKDRLIKDGKFTRSRIGISWSNPSQEMMYFSNFKTETSGDPAPGVIVGEIISNGPASKSGLKVNDVIVAVDGAPVATGRELKKEVSFKKPGQTITLSVLRDNHKQTIKITTEAEAEVPEETVSAAAPERGPEAEYGFVVKTWTKELADRLGANPDVASGLIVISVLPNSPADMKGFVAGDVITKFNNKPVAGLGEFTKALEGLAPGQQWTLEKTGKDGDQFKVMRAPAQFPQ